MYTVSAWEFNRFPIHGAQKKGQVTVKVNGRIDGVGVVSGCHAGPLPFLGKPSATQLRSLQRCAADCGDPNSLPHGVGTFLEN